MSSISIVIPAFNPGRYLGDAIKSILCQSYPDWELLIIDDGSTEDIAALVPRDPRIQVYRQTNLGLSAARNAGIMRSSGDLIAFLDADDAWLPHKLGRQVDQLRLCPDAVLAHSQMRFTDENGREGSLGWGGGYQTYDELLEGCGVCVSSVVIRRETLFRCGLFDPLLATAQDYDLWLKASRHGAMIADPEPLVLYRWHGNNMSRDYMRTHRELIAILRRHEAIASREGNVGRAAKCRQGIRRTHRNTSIQAGNAMMAAFKDKAFNATLRHLIRALRVSPVFGTQRLALRLKTFLSLSSRPTAE